MSTADTSPITVGARVHDREDADPSDAIVITVRDCTVAECDLPGTADTIADVNSDYPADDTAVVVAFESELADHLPDWSVATPATLHQQVDSHAIRTYTYPASRLAFVEQTPVRPRRTDDGQRYISRLRITGVGDRLVYGTDYDGVDHGAGTTRDVCFHKQDWDLTADNHVSVTYAREKDIDDLPPMLVGVDTVEVVEQAASPDYLLDL